MYHRPVLLKESIEGLAVKPDGIYVDVTFGGGGHSAEIIRLLTTGRLIAFDQDSDAMSNAIDDERFILVNRNFRYLIPFLRYYHALPCDGILADLGVSSHQFDSPDRGFSTRFDGEPDMRMNRNKSLTATEVLNTYEEKRLEHIFSTYGEIDNARKLAYIIIKQRQDQEIQGIHEFKELMAVCAPKGKENQYYAQVFQALRIEVNGELDALAEFLEQTGLALKPGGRLVVISYHSLEDRLVKNYTRCGNIRGDLDKDFYGNVRSVIQPINRKPITPGKDEMELNPRSRSARLRIAEKL
jgi:16S rRNA (cytosine1402-N4)-methyltransferase